MVRQAVRTGARGSTARGVGAGGAAFTRRGASTGVLAGGAAGTGRSTTGGVFTSRAFCARLLAPRRAVLTRRTVFEKKPHHLVIVCQSANLDCGAQVFGMHTVASVSRVVQPVLRAREVLAAAGTAVTTIAAAVASRLCSLFRTLSSQRDDL